MSRSSSGVSRGSSSRSTSRWQRRSATSSVRRRASVGWAVRTGAIARRPMSSTMSSSPRPVRQIRRTASATESSRIPPRAARSRRRRVRTRCRSSARLTSWKYRPNDADERLGPRQVEAVELGRQARPLDRVVGPAEGDRPAPDPLDELEQVEALLLDDDLAEQRAEEPDLARQRVAGAGRPDAARLAADGRVRAGGHRRLLRRSRSAAPAARPQESVGTVAGPGRSGRGGTSTPPGDPERHRRSRRTASSVADAIPAGGRRAARRARRPPVAVRRRPPAARPAPSRPRRGPRSGGRARRPARRRRPGRGGPSTAGSRRRSRRREPGRTGPSGRGGRPARRSCPPRSSRPTGPRTTTIPPVMYSQPCAPSPSTTASAPLFRTANRIPARPTTWSRPAVAPNRQTLPASGRRRRVGDDLRLRPDDDDPARQALGQVVVGLADERQLDALRRGTRRSSDRRLRAARAGSGHGRVGGSHRARRAPDSSAPNDRSAVPIAQPLGAGAGSGGAGRGARRDRARRSTRAPAGRRRRRASRSARRAGSAGQVAAPTTAVEVGRARRRAGDQEPTAPRRRSRRPCAPRSPPARAGGPRPPPARTARPARACR